ncbi:hypothetical protein BOX15_Mlig020962g2, partial [Macrostomum lignano]
PKALKNRSRKKLDYGRRRSAPQMTAARRHDSSDYLSAARPRSPQSAGASPQSTWSGQQPLEQLGGRRPHQARSTGGSCLSLRSNRRTPAIGLTSPSVPENAAPEAGSAPERSFEESQRVSGGLESGHGSSMSSHGSLDSGLMPENGDESDDSSSFGSSRGFCNRDEPTGNAAAGAGGEELQVDSLEHSPDAAATGHLDAQIRAESPGAAATRQLNVQSGASQHGQRGRFRKFLQQLNCFKAAGSDADSGYSSLFSSRISLASRVSNSTNPPNPAADCEHLPLVVSSDAGSALGGTSGAIEAMPTRMESTV